LTDQSSTLRLVASRLTRILAMTWFEIWSSRDEVVQWQRKSICQSKSPIPNLHRPQLWSPSSLFPANAEEVPKQKRCSLEASSLYCLGVAHQITSCTVSNSARTLQTLKGKFSWSDCQMAVLTTSWHLWRASNSMFSWDTRGDKVDLVRMTYCRRELIKARMVPAIDPMPNVTFTTGCCQQLSTACSSSV